MLLLAAKVHNISIGTKLLVISKVKSLIINRPSRLIRYLWSKNERRRH